MTTPQEPAPDTETDVTPGDVTESPTKPSEDGSNTHDGEEDTVPEVPQGPQETNPDAGEDEGDGTQPGQMPDHDTEVGA